MLGAKDADRVEASRRAEKPLKGHKGRIVHGVRYDCECGWSSTPFWGTGATGQAANDFHYHKRKCILEGGA